MSEKLFSIFLTALFVVLFAMPSLIKVAKLKNLVDSPTEDRKMHRWSIPTLGGVVIFGAIVFSYTLWFPVEYDFIDGTVVNFKFLIASLILLFFVGVKDDVIGTAPIKKLIAHIIVAFILVVMANLRIESMHGIFWEPPAGVSGAVIGMNVAPQAPAKYGRASHISRLIFAHVAPYSPIFHAVFPHISHISHLLLAVECCAVAVQLLPA